MRCVECSKPPIRFLRRGLCESCYQRVLTYGDIEDYPLTKRRWWETAEEYEFLKGQETGDIHSIASRMGITTDGLRKALKKAGVTYV